MIQGDKFLFEFLKHNHVILDLIFGSGLAFLKGLAKITKSTTDDKIVTMLQNLGSSVLSTRKKGEKDEENKS